MNHIRKFGLIGHPLKHSFSPGYFAAKFKNEGINDAVYDLYDLECVEDFMDLAKKDFVGLNVTIPYKELIIPYLDDLSSEAKEIGAVNTIKFENGKLKGYNTDSYGFEQSLKEFYGLQKPEKALILGSGGASKAVKFTLEKLGIEFQIVSRKKGYFNYSELNASMFKGKLVVINTTPLGTWPDIDNAPDIPYQYINSEHFLYDLVYNPEKTLFLSLGQKQNAAIKNGYDMLKLQAEKSWQIWNGI